MILTRAFRRRMYRGGRPHWLARALNQISAWHFATGFLAPGTWVTLEVTGRRSGPILRRYLAVAPGACPHVPIDRRAPIDEFRRIAADYPVFRVMAAGRREPGG